MKRIIILIIFCFNLFQTNGQSIGQLAPEPESIKFPPKSYGADIMFSEGGFGLGAFYRKSLTETMTGVVDFSISEAKDENEFEYIDYYGISHVYGKVNRIFLLPLYAGVQYRLFSSMLSDNLRPYVNLSVGPTMLVTTPYEKEFFNSFRYAHARYTLGGYFGLGANFGLDQKNLIGISLRYYIVHMLGEGIESLNDRPRKDLGGFYLVINVGSMMQ